MYREPNATVARQGRTIANVKMFAGGWNTWGTLFSTIKRSANGSDKTNAMKLSGRGKRPRVAECECTVRCLGTARRENSFRNSYSCMPETMARSRVNHSVTSSITLIATISMLTCMAEVMLGLTHSTGTEPESART